MRNAAVAAAAVVICLGCCLNPEEVRVWGRAAILPGAVDVECRWFDADNNGVAFRYTLPFEVAKADALQVIARQIAATGNPNPRTQKPCFETVVAAPDHLVMVCRDEGVDAYGAWEIRLADRTIHVIHGPPDYVLDHVAPGARGGNR